MPAFLLRYQESCAEASAGVAVALSRLVVRREATDGAGAEGVGTTTKTSTDTEPSGRDQDRTTAGRYAPPATSRPLLAAKTQTRIEREQPDRACGEAARAIPWPDAPAGLTKTSTAVRAEADDRDPKRSALEAIPACS
jgi:hypothetical protein